MKNYLSFVSVVLCVFALVLFVGCEDPNVNTPVPQATTYVSYMDNQGTAVSEDSAERKVEMIISANKDSLTMAMFGRSAVDAEWIKQEVYEMDMEKIPSDVDVVDAPSDEGYVFYRMGITKLGSLEPGDIWVEVSPAGDGESVLEESYMLFKITDESLIGILVDIDETVDPPTYTADLVSKQELTRE